MRILINASTSVGDSLYFAFMLDNIYRRYPNASIQLMCWHPMVSFYRSFPFVEQIIPYDQIVKDTKFSIFLLHPKIDIFIDLQHTEESALLGQSINALKRIGVNPHRAMYSCYDYVIVPEKGEHIYEAFYRGFRELWPEYELEPRLNIRINQQQGMLALSLLLENNISIDDDFVIIHPGAKGKDKLWNNRSWAVIVDYLYSKGFKVVLIGSSLKGWGGTEILDQFNCDEIYHLMPYACVNLAGKLADFLVLSALIKKSMYYCGLDTGPTHLASLLDIPVFEIYKYYDENTFNLWKPYGNKTYLISNSNLDNVSAKDFIELLEEHAPVYADKTTQIQ